MRITDKRIWTGVTAIYYVLILYLLCVPQQELPTVEIPYVDKGVHVLLFCVLGMLLGYVTQSFQVGLRWGIVLSGISECAQFFTPDRSVDVMDFFADVGGVLVGLTIIRRIPFFNGVHDADYHHGVEK